MRTQPSGRGFYPVVDFYQARRALLLPGTISSVSTLGDAAAAKGEAAFAVGHLPMPVHMLHVYGKVGVAHLRTTVNATNLGHPECTQVCSAIAWIPGAYRHDATSIDLAYGAGLQLNLAAAGIRFEYERVRRGGGDTDLASVGATWAF